MRARRLRTPATDGGWLIEPPLSHVDAQIAGNTARWADWDYDFQGRRARRLRGQIRREVLARAREFLLHHGVDAGSVDLDAAIAGSVPLIVTGHQPELFHPGVWVKNFALAGIVRSCHGLGLNLIIDNDIPKEASIRVPTIAGDRIRAVRIEFDRWQGETPYEDLKVRDEPTFATFRDRVRQVLGETVKDPVLGEFWPRALRRRGETDSLGLRFSLARRELEGSWGVSNLEIPYSAVCQTDGFLWFASHLLAQLPRYHEIHNAALAAYRTIHRIRSHHHPVAALTRRDDWLEAPFWVWRASEPRRRALLVRQSARFVQLRIDREDQVLLELPLTPDGEACCAVERLRDLAGQSVRLRTRALTTTMFSRFLLGDLFLHGIGGAKYDELGDEIARRFFGITPPEFLTLSMTQWLGLSIDPATPEELAAVNRQIRDLRFNPDRYLDEPNSEDVRSILMAKREAMAGPITSRGERIARGMTIRRCNEALQPWVQTLRSDLATRQTRLRAGIRSNRVAQNREFAFVLHSAQRLRETFLPVGSGVAIGSTSARGSRPGRSGGVPD
jgi:hypothetical protein